jgi:exopolysaccharide production protein ExoY
MLCLVVLLPCWAPIMAAIGVFIKLASPGPVFYVQKRIGYRGRRFNCIKFRTMRPHANCAAHQDHVSRLMRTDAPMTKLDASGDPRLIPLGAFLRATGLDELPQVLNVLRGEMSLVGPRPCTRFEYGHYRPEQKERFNALPGLTGLWQVSGKNETTFSEMIALDITYVRSQSVWLDLRIMARTFGVLVEQVRRVSQAARPEPVANGEPGII